MRSLTALLTLVFWIASSPALAGTLVEAERASGSSSVKIVLMCLGAVGVVALALPKVGEDA